MRLDLAFRVSSYLTLALACACLGYAEFTFLPEIVWFGGATAVLLILAFWTEGRWALTIAAANWLAPVIALGGTAWVVHHVVQGKDSWLSTTPWPAAGLPYLGPILMLLVAALVFRPKRAVEIWWLHGAGLMAIALGSSMADDSLFGFLVLVYLASGLWCLALFCLYREQQNLDGNGGQPRDRLAEPLVGGPTSHCPP